MHMQPVTLLKKKKNVVFYSSAIAPHLGKLRVQFHRKVQMDSFNKMNDIFL